MTGPVKCGPAPDCGVVVIVPPFCPLPLLIFKIFSLLFFGIFVAAALHCSW